MQAQPIVCPRWLIQVDCAIHTGRYSESKRICLRRCNQRRILHGFCPRGYNVLTESAVEFRFALGNGFLGMRAARSISRGPTWVSWLGYGIWASWPRCYVARLFDIPNVEPPVPALVPVADWSRVRVVLDGEPLLAREGEIRVGVRKLDLRRGVLISTWTYRTLAGVTFEGLALRLLSLADRAGGLQLLRFSLDRDDVDIVFEAAFSLAGLGMEPIKLEQESVPGALRAPARLLLWPAPQTCGSVAIRSSRTSFPAPLALAMAVRSRPGSRIRSIRPQQQELTPPRQSGPARRSRTGAQSYPRLARGSLRTRRRLEHEMDRE